jgi:hypothetical protein
VENFQAPGKTGAIRLIARKSRAKIFSALDFFTHSTPSVFYLMARR